MITQQYLKERLIYHPLTGHFFWKHKDTGSKWDKRWNSRWAGKRAGYVSELSGYDIINIDHQDYPAHRLAFLYITGAFPTDEVDHINRDRSDNRWGKIRLVSHRENNMNTGMQKNNTSGQMGVYWEKSQSKWSAKIKINYKSIHLGTFELYEDACAARKDAEQAYDFHPNHGTAA